MITKQKFDEMMEEFGKLDYKKKKVKVIDMLRWFQEFDKKYKEMLEMIEWDNDKKIPENVFFDIYELIMEFGFEMWEIKNEKVKIKFDRVRNKLEEMKEKEMVEDEKDNVDADNLLNNI